MASVTSLDPAFTTPVDLDVADQRFLVARWWAVHGGGASPPDAADPRLAVHVLVSMAEPPPGWIAAVSTLRTPTGLEIGEPLGTTPGSVERLVAGLADRLRAHGETSIATRSPAVVRSLGAKHASEADDLVVVPL